MSRTTMKLCATATLGGVAVLAASVVAAPRIAPSASSDPVVKAGSGRDTNVGFDPILRFAADRRAMIKPGGRVRGVADLPNLTVSDVDASALTGQWQELTASGDVVVTVENLGPGAPGANPEIIIFEDNTIDPANTPGVYDAGIDFPLGTDTIDAALLSAGAGVVITFTLADQPLLFRGNAIYAVVDSEQQIEEANEGDNTGTSAADCQITGENAPPLAIELEWSWPPGGIGGQGVLPKSKVTCTPLVVDLTGDGRPEIVFSGYDITQGQSSGALTALNTNDGSVLWKVDTTANPAQSLRPHGLLIAGDIDANGSLPEIIGIADGSGNLICFNADGSLRWISEPIETLEFITGGWGGGPSAIADFDLDEPGNEILYGRQIVYNDGTVLTLGAGGFGDTGYGGRMSVAADVDLDGRLEIVAGNTVYDDVQSGNTILWTAKLDDGTPLADGKAAVANFDDDARPEVVLVTGNTVSLIDDDGIAIWGPTTIPGGPCVGCSGSNITTGIIGGPPTVADFNGDGRPQIGTVNRSRYVVFNDDGSVSWTFEVQDGSGITGSTVFDFNGDGAAEVVYGDERNFFVLDGGGTGADTDGDGFDDTTAIATFPLSSLTSSDMPVVADVDNDGQAEIVKVANAWTSPSRGIFVFGSPNNDWRPARRVWNQHTYSITHINEDGSVASPPDINWLANSDGVIYNNFRQQVADGEQSGAGRDLTASFIRSGACGGGGGEVTAVTARIGNGGLQSAAAGVNISFYLGDPFDAASTLIGTTQTTKTLATGEFEDVVLTLPAGTTVFPGDVVSVAADDSGAFPGQITGVVGECDKTNNVHGAQPTPLELQLAIDIYPNTVENPIVLDTNYTIYVAVLNKEGEPDANDFVDPTTVDWANSEVVFGTLGNPGAVPVALIVGIDIDLDEDLDTILGFKTFAGTNFSMGDSHGELRLRTPCVNATGVDFVNVSEDVPSP